MAPQTHHEPLKALGPVQWESADQDDLDAFVKDIMNNVRTVIDSLPVPAPIRAVTSAGRSRSHTDPAIQLVDLNRAISQRQSAESIGHSQNLMKEWKEVKINTKENPLSINVYKLAAKDGKGSWFARRSVHDGLTFEKWKLGLEREFAETMRSHTAPGAGNVRGIGAERMVQRRVVDESAKMEVFQLSAQFPGPTTPRDFVTLLITSESLAFTTSSGDSKRPLRQFVVVSKPCIHPDCPPRQGFIRGQYESVEIIREVPADKPTIRRARSSIDLGSDGSKEAKQVAEELGKEAIIRAARKATSENEGRDPGMTSSTSLDDHGVTFESAGDVGPPSIEWLMVTRSDPGGSVPRFMIEKGTPGGIVSDAGKFLNWVTRKAIEDFAPSDANDFKKEARVAEEKLETNTQPLHSPTANLVPDDSASQSQSVPSSNGLYGMITGAIGAASSVVATRLPHPFGGPSSGRATPTIPEEDQDDDSAQSETSSIRSFASALESSTLGEHTPETQSLAAENTSIHSDESRKQGVSQNEKELKKLQERRHTLQDKIAKMQERMMSKRNEERERDAAAVAKLQEKHEREIAKQEEKYRREMKRLQEKREQEERKAEERRRKTAEREEKANLSLELERARAERDVALKQMDILKVQVGELQAQNTMLVAQLGRMGLSRDASSMIDLGKKRTNPGRERDSQSVKG